MCTENRVFSKIITDSPKSLRPLLAAYNSTVLAYFYIFYLHHATLARTLPMALRPSVSVSVCLPQVCVLSKDVDELSWSLLLPFLPTSLVNRQIGVGDSKNVIVFDPLLTGHVIRRMRSGRVHIFNGNQKETL